MRKKKSKTTPKSLSPSQVTLRFFIAGVLIMALIFIALMANRWYLYTHSTPPENVVVAPPPPVEPPPSSDSSPESEDSSDLTFYDRLTQKEPLDPALPVSSADGAEQKHTQPPKGQAISKPKFPDRISSPPQEPMGGRAYTVQVASFQSLEYARNSLESIKEQGYNASISTVYLPNGKTWHRVRIDNFASREEAEKAAMELKKSGEYEPMIMKVDG